ncbi:hypothetical protein [Crocinitomix algicola]|jgi:hypothetical protein|uniref:hypothetical protein n=1 Tax=Crocinitomix algicola TaxID=1740263 RepID=UPI000872876A|nr:hypothetical protein [Crocinitomix algicola]
MKIEEKERIYNFVISPSGYSKEFKKVAQIIETQLKIKFRQKLNDLESYYWVFDFEGAEINLHLNEMIGDVELFVDKSASNNLVLKTLIERVNMYTK